MHARTKQKATPRGAAALQEFVEPTTTTSSAKESISNNESNIPSRRPNQ